jgi:tRNA-modifying protein YgfZ
MSTATFGFLPLLDRAVVAVTGADAVGFLDNLATNALDKLKPGEARFSALLTPQGKIAYEFFAYRTADGFLLDTHRATTAEFVKRLTLYKLRAKVTIKDESAAMLVAASPEPPKDTSTPAFLDPRDPALGLRVLSRDPTLRLAFDPENEAAYLKWRIARGIPQAGLDYTLGDTFPHEANYDQIAGVSFTKGCFVGQEVVARMQNKTVVRKRVVKVSGQAPLTAGAALLVGAAEIGRVGSVYGRDGLALLRLDRVVEARDKGETMTANGVAVTADAQALSAYSKSVADRPVVDL